MDHRGHGGRNAEARRGGGKTRWLRSFARKRNGRRMTGYLLLRSMVVGEFKPAPLKSKVAASK